MPHNKKTSRTTQKLRRAPRAEPRPQATPSGKTLYTKLGELTRFIDETMRTLGDVERPLVRSTKHLPQASRALIDLISMTEEGTHRIMDLTEILLENHKRLSVGLDGMQAACGTDANNPKDIRTQAAALADIVATNEKAVMDILTNLSFQDLVGQRLKKVVEILQDVQGRLLELVVVFGQQNLSKQVDTGRSVMLLKELEQADTAIKQEVVDELLQEYGF